ncbi:MAG: hypothetical protein KGV56_06200 [Gammaproteobacteria bacterium]|nr:hypothetical protein [Gammaproteobacteria bacterium]
MKFTIQRTTEEDLQTNPKLKSNGISINEDWVVNENKDTFLLFSRSDRQDMGGTRDEWWLCCYKGHYLILRVELLDVVEIDDTDFVKLLLKDISITPDNSHEETVQLNELNIEYVDLFRTLNEMFSIYKSYEYWGGKFQKEYNIQVEIVDRV